MKALFLLALFLCFSCGETISTLTEHEKSVIMKANGLVSMEQWFPDEGSQNQPKFLLEKKDGKEFVGKPQIIGNELVELTYIALKALNNLEGLYKKPLEIHFDFRNFFLFVEKIPKECQSIEKIRDDPQVFMDAFKQKLEAFKKKIAHLEILDLHDGNIMICDNPNYDLFYVIDSKQPRSSDFIWEVVKAFERHNHWVREKLGRKKEELNYLSKLLWGRL